MLFQNCSQPSISTIAYANNHVEGSVCFDDGTLDLSTTSFSHPNNGDSFEKVEVYTDKLLFFVRYCISL